MNHVTKAEHYKSYRNRVISSLKRFNKLLNAESLTTGYRDHYLRPNESENAIEFTFSKPESIWGDYHVSCSSEHTSIQRLNKHFNHVRSCFNHERTLAYPVDALDELLWIGGEAEEASLARVLGVSKVIIRDRSEEGSQDTIYARCRESNDWSDHVRRWVLVINNRLHRREARFDYVQVSRGRHEVILFSRYFVSPDDLLSLVYADTYRSHESTGFSASHLSPLERAKRLLRQSKRTELHSKSHIETLGKWQVEEADND